MQGRQTSFHVKDDEDTQGLSTEIPGTWVSLRAVLKKDLAIRCSPVAHQHTFRRGSDADGAEFRERGRLLKKGGFRRNWQERFFYLDFPKAELRYYKSKDLNPSGLKGAIRFGAASSFNIPENKQFKGRTGKGMSAKEGHYFELRLLTDGAGKPRSVFAARAGSQVQLQQWKASIEFVIQKQIEAAAGKGTHDGEHVLSQILAACSI